MKKKPTVAAIVVTYNRKDLLKENLKCLLNQTYKPDKIIIIDNHSTDGTKTEIEDIVKKYKLEYVELKRNLGGAGGFTKGIDYATKKGYDYIWGMDDDAFPDKNALRSLMERLKDFPENTCFWSNPDKDTKFNKTGAKEVEAWMFLGFFLPTKIVKKIGLPRADFFIYQDDFEYAKRIQKNGYKIYKIKDSKIEHNSGKLKYLKKKFLGKELGFPEMPDWKRYYYARNIILAYKWSEKHKWKLVFIEGPLTVIKLCLLDITKAGTYFKGYIHGVFNLSGKRVDPSKG